MSSPCYQRLFLSLGFARDGEEGLRLSPSPGRIFRRFLPQWSIWGKRSPAGFSQVGCSWSPSLPSPLWGEWRLGGTVDVSEAATVSWGLACRGCSETVWKGPAAGGLRPPSPSLDSGGGEAPPQLPAPPGPHPSWNPR